MSSAEGKRGGAKSLKSTRAFARPMPPFLVKAKLKPGQADAFEARLADGTLAEGSDVQDALVAALRGAHRSRDEIYFLVEARNDSIREERRVLEPFLDVKSVLPVHESFDDSLLDDDEE